MLALMRFVWERIKDIHDAAWLLPSAVVATVSGMGVSIWAATDKVPNYLWIPLGLLTCILFMHFAYMFLEAKEHLIRLPLEIIFDSANSQQTFLVHHSYK